MEAPACPKCGGRTDLTISRDVKPDVALCAVACTQCAYADSAYLGQLADDADGLHRYGPMPPPAPGRLSQPPPANLAEPPANNLEE